MPNFHFIKLFSTMCILQLAKQINKLQILISPSVPLNVFQCHIPTLQLKVFYSLLCPNILISSGSQRFSPPNLPHYKLLVLSQPSTPAAFPGKTQTTLAREADKLTTHFHLSVFSSKSNLCSRPSAVALFLKD